jgi:hypothetical protein
VAAPRKSIYNLIFLYFSVNFASMTQNASSRQYTHSGCLYNRLRCFFIDWSLMESSCLHTALRKVSNSVTYLITLSSALLSYYKFRLELFDSTAYEYANSFTADVVSCFLINLHVVRFFRPPVLIFKVSFLVASTPPVAFFPRFA